MGVPTIERRALERVATTDRRCFASMAFAAVIPLVTLHDGSATVHSTAALRFDLSLDGFKTTRHRRVVWRNGNTCGVKFVDQLTGQGRSASRTVRSRSEDKQGASVPCGIHTFWGVQTQLSLVSFSGCASIALQVPEKTGTANDNTPANRPRTSRRLPASGCWTQVRHHQRNIHPPPVHPVRPPALQPRS